MPAMKAAVSAEAGWAKWMAYKLVLILYTMLVVSLLGSRAESVVLGELSIVVVASIAVLCRLTGNYGPLKWAAFPALMTVMLVR